MTLTGGSREMDLYYHIADTFTDSLVMSQFGDSTCYEHISVMLDVHIHTLLHTAALVFS